MARSGYTIDGARLGQARIERGLTQTELADRAGIHRVTLTKIENGSPLSLELLERLAAELNVTRSWLLGQKDEEDEFELARERVANAMETMGGALEDFAAAVQALKARARAASERDGVAR